MKSPKRKGGWGRNLPFNRNKTSRRGVSTDIDVSFQYAKDLAREANTATKALGNIVHKRNLPKIGAIAIENELKLVQDKIPDSTWFYAGTLTQGDAHLYRQQAEVKKLEADGRLSFFHIEENGFEVEEQRADDLMMQNDLINTAKVTFEYTGRKKMVTTLRAKLMYDLAFDEDNRHYEAGIFKTNYRIRSSKSLEIIPMYKYTLRNGFKMAEERVTDEVIAIETENGKEERHIRLRDVNPTDLRDQTHAFILKTIYQFTKTIKITGGVQLLLFNDMLDDERDFIRQAVLGELEKNFVAYEKDLFLHIGARYIDQRARGTANDQNFMQTFVRVFTKF